MPVDESVDEFVSATYSIWNRQFVGFRPREEAFRSAKRVVFFADLSADFERAGPVRSARIDNGKSLDPRACLHALFFGFLNFGTIGLFFGEAAGDFFFIGTHLSQSDFAFRVGGRVPVFARLVIDVVVVEAWFCRFEIFALG